MTVSAEDCVEIEENRKLVVHHQLLVNTCLPPVGEPFRISCPPSLQVWITVISFSI